MMSRTFAFTCLAAVLIAVSTGAASPRAHAPVSSRPIILSRLDQSSRWLIASNVQPGFRVDAYANGYLIAQGYPQFSKIRLALRRSPVPGSRVIVVQRSLGGFVVGQGDQVVQGDYLTNHFDNARTGWNPYEQTLKVKNVGSAHFGLLFNLNLDADAMAQPLYVPNVSIPGDGPHDVIYAATENDTLYAFDAESGAGLWASSFINPAAGITAVPASDVLGCRDIYPNIGITSTPVIDTTSNTIYLVTKVVAVANNVKTWHQYVHAVDLGTGLDKPGSPVEIQASVTVPGERTIAFDPRWSLNRPGLLLANNTVYVAFGSHCDYRGTLARGWIMGFAADTLAPNAAMVMTTDNEEGFGSIWQSGYGVAADDAGNIFPVTGNGAFDGQSNFGNSVVRLRPDLTIQDFFTPYYELGLDQGDVDFGSGGAMLLPVEGGAYPDLLVAAGKDRTLFLLSRDDLGGFTPNGPDRVVQEIPGAVGVQHGLWGGPAYYLSPSGQPFIYVCGGQDHLKAFILSTSPSTALVPAMQTSRTFNGLGGTTPVVSSNGETAGTAIVWAINRPSNGNPAIRLLAYDAVNLSHQLVSLPAGSYDNNRGSYFGVPTVVNGHVYVGIGRSIAVFGER